MCGENSTLIARLGGDWGSSPRVRGKPRPHRRILGVLRLIPACAGKTLSSKSRARVTSAHPRMCGENTFPFSSCIEMLGSSPRVRGKLSEVLHAIRRVRLIPACAGKTSAAPPWPWTSTAHPRVCGENLTMGDTAADSFGSSPRVRGKLASGLTRLRIPRLIPACAGKTQTRHACSTPRAAHPRVCGENVVFSFLGSPPTGSSPRVLGKRRCRTLAE